MWERAAERDRIVADKDVCGRQMCRLHSFSWLSGRVEEIVAPQGGRGGIEGPAVIPKRTCWFRSGPGEVNVDVVTDDRVGGSQILSAVIAAVAPSRQGAADGVMTSRCVT